MSVVLLLAVLLLIGSGHNPDAAATLSSLAVASPAVLFLWLMRRAPYIDARPKMAAVAGLAYALLLPAGLLLLLSLGWLTSATSVLTMGAAWG
jgi:hypothetical protein